MQTRCEILFLAADPLAWARIDALDSIADIVAKLSGPATKASTSKSGKKKKENDDALAAKVRTMVGAYLASRGDSSIEM